ncbi:MAG: hypothetical protein DMG85_18275 [Acidobacteria bacterium]|nr:MAG: hypothetical protein DMG85_18275 [Acidobacteriota bacterium]
MRDYSKVCFPRNLNLLFLQNLPVTGGPMSSSKSRSAARWLVFLCCFMGSTLLFAQSTGGRILGRVADPTGAVLSGVKVTLTNEATDISRDVQTNSSGDYVLVEVPPGVYDVQFEHKGFKKNLQKGVTVDVNQIVTVNTTMQLGAAQEVVEVTSFLQLQPGVMSTVGSANSVVYGNDRAGAVSVNGGRGRSNNFSVNGGDANDQFVNLPTVQPSPDSIAEFRVLTNTFDAEYGRNSGSVVNVVTKSGTNSYHGNVYEFFRNTVLNANAYCFTALQGIPCDKPKFNQNQFGATFGGPIKKDRTFFFTSYEGRRIRQGIPSPAVTVPTAAERPDPSHMLNGHIVARPAPPLSASR